MGLFVSHRRHVFDLGVQAAVVVPAFDVGKERKVDLRRGPVGLAAGPLRLQRRKEALARGVVVAGGHPTHRLHDANLAAPLAERDRGVLAAAVGVMDHALRLSRLDRLPEHSLKLPRGAGARDWVRIIVA